jgi:polygalacturonase
MKTRREFLFRASYSVAAAVLSPKNAYPGVKGGAEYDVRKFGAVGDGVTVDSPSIQRAIDTASARGGGRVLLPGGRRFVTGALVLKSGVELHLADDVVLFASVDPADYAAEEGILNANGARGLKITGTGNIDGQAMKFMTTYSETDERWEPKKFRPRMFSLKSCRDLEISGISFGHSPQWGMHLLGCERVLVDGVRVRNYMDVPNCDGIDPDRCRDVEIRNCDIVCADDGVVIKTSEQSENYGSSRNIVVKDCVVTSRDSGLKIGTETFGDVSKVLFERCKVISGGRGPTITHRQPGNIEDIEFRDIEVSAEHHAARWWGWGEAVSVTAWPRTAEGKVGYLRNIRMRNIKGRSENSVRIDGQKDQPVEDVLLENVDVTLDRWTKYPGGRFDNRPTKPGDQGLEAHGTPVFSVRNARNVIVKDCVARWGNDRQEYFTNALEAENVQGLKIEHFTGEAAFPGQQKAIEIR